MSSTSDDEVPLAAECVTPATKAGFLAGSYGTPKGMPLQSMLEEIP
jgi:hypothetical protein